MREGGREGGSHRFHEDLLLQLSHLLLELSLHARLLVAVTTVEVLHALGIGNEVGNRQVNTCDNYYRLSP